MKNGIWMSVVGLIAVAGISVGVMNLGSPAIAQNMSDGVKQEAPKEKPKAGGIKPGDMAPDFSLTDTEGKTYRLADVLKADGTKAVVIEWFNPECPFVVKHHSKNPTFANLHKEFSGKGVTFMAINSGAPGKQGHGKELNQKMRTEWKIQYPVLIDEDGKVGRAYGARTTPHMFIVTPDGKVAYAGAIDNNRSADKAGDVNYVSKALNEVLAGQTVSEASTNPYGCSVKYGK
ncbi:MAG: thioredoxin family protein [Phycisphaerales bacterium]|nr:thioredoxin family protein [Phycisphaeraceae bacterium]